MRPKRSISERAPLALQRRQLLSLLSDQTPNRLSGNVCTGGPDTKTWQNHGDVAFKSLKSTAKTVATATAPRRVLAQVINRKRRGTSDFKKMGIPNQPPTSQHASHLFLQSGLKIRTTRRSRIRTEVLLQSIILVCVKT